MSLSQYKFEILPHDELSVQQWAPKFIEFRLNALKAAPASFSSSYEKEARITKADWVSLLSEPAFRVVIAVVRTDDDSLPVWESEWVMTSNLYGPRCHHQPYHDNATDCHESSWYVAASFVSPQHRHGGMLLEAFYTCERAAVSEDRQSFEKRHQAQLLRRSGRSLQYRTRMLGTLTHRHPAVLKYYRSTGLEISYTMQVKDFARWGWKVPVNPEKLDKEITVMEKIIPWEAEPMARL
ncbi:hypothetical protein N7520_004685 [Penicillium odoratum]|uniref:uncharacterized protein n=1 Tax=Penicillium odoratum TaxID=1167516 RepID=UPI002549938E|nr:uncharacterized protein N7520_004685 [Penicillium odoratum]KAJ5765126.1 hypothetical protein N7520_004685 [Penicillium odoratum]